MANKKRGTKTDVAPSDLTKTLNEVAERSVEKSLSKNKAANNPNGDSRSSSTSSKRREDSTEGSVEDIEITPELEALFQTWDDEAFEPSDFMIEVPVDSLESSVGYLSLIRQMHQAFVRRVAFFKSPMGGSLSTKEARDKAFHACTNKDEAIKKLRWLSDQPLESLDFTDLLDLYAFAPRVAERFWERAKKEGRTEFESGHLSANIAFPVGYMKGLWNIARYMGVRESFIEEWKPKGGIEMSLIDTMVQAHFQSQYWIEQTVRRSQTTEREDDPDYSTYLVNKRLEERRQQKQETPVEKGMKERWSEGYWFRPYVTEQQAIEHAVQMVDRWNRIFTRTLRQLRDLRRYSPVTINNANQVNIASEGGQQINMND